MANVHRWGADDWIDRNGEVKRGGSGGREGRGKVKFRQGVVVVVVVRGVQRRAMTF